MGAGAGSPIQAKEIVWRLIEDNWYQLDATGKQVVQEAAFVGQVSLLRESLLTQQHVDTAKGCKFAKYGIARLSVADIRNITKGDVRIDPDKDWPQDAHVLFFRHSGGKNLQLTHVEVLGLTKLANQTPLFRRPKP